MTLVANYVIKVCKGLDGKREHLLLHGEATYSCEFCGVTIQNRTCFETVQEEYPSGKDKYV